MTISRRQFLTVLGSSAVIVAAGAGGYLGTRTPTRALAPWQNAGKPDGDPRRVALSYAILAPNPHNRQPWLVDLVDDNEIVLYCDPTRLLKETDPFDRQITIGLGCFLEILRMAAAEQGYRAEITPFPKGVDETALDARPVAQIRLIEDAGALRDSLFRQVLDRHTNREAFDTARPVEAGKLDRLRAVALGNAVIHTTNEPDRVEQLRGLTWNAMVVELKTPDAYLESVELMRIGKAEIEANPDGLVLDSPFMNAMYDLGLISREQIGDPASSAYKQGFDMLRPAFGTAMAYAWITSAGNTRFAQLDAGRSYVRLHLQAAELGLALQPLSQALQEYEEMNDLYRQIHSGLAIAEGTRIQMLARLGYGPQIGPSPRWPAETRIRAS